MDSPVVPTRHFASRTLTEEPPVELGDATDIVRGTLMVTLLIASPMLLIGLVVGVAISILQAITQIQEQTLSMIPKIAAMMIATAVLLPWISVRLLEYSHSMFLFGRLP